MEIKVKKFQEGGAMPAPEAPEQGGAPAGAPAPEQGGQDPLMMLAEMAMQALQSQDCNAMAQVCEGFLQLVQQAQGGGAPEEAAPQGEPVYRRGGVLSRRIKA